MEKLEAPQVSRQRVDNMPTYLNYDGMLCYKHGTCELNRHSSNSWSTTKYLAFCSRRAKVKLGGLVGGHYCTFRTANKWRNKQSFNTYAYTLTLFHLFSEKICFADTYPETSKMCTKREEKAQFPEMHKQGEIEKSIFANELGQDTATAGVQAQWRTDHVKAVASRAHMGPAGTAPPPLGPTFLWRLHDTMHRMVLVVSLFSSAKPTILGYK